MKYMKLRRCQVPMVTILVVPAALGCVRGGETPPDQLPIVTDAVEVASQAEARGVLFAGFLGDIVQDRVSKAFQRTASIELQYTETNPDLPAPIGSPDYPDWPDYTVRLDVYQEYARLYHDSPTYPWVIFYVNHYVKNTATSCAEGVHFGASSFPGANVVPSDPEDRFTFVFVTDVRDFWQTLCAVPVEELENVMAHYVTHEYGHQRAGLTEYYWQQSPPGNSQYHSRNAWDIDRPFLVALERAEWDSIVAATKAALSDAVIDSAVARLPPEHYAIAGPTLARRLKARRDRLERAADDLYRIVNQAADIHATDEDEIATIVYERDGTLTVSVAPAEAAGAPYFRRSFDPAVTREVRLYLLDGDDSVSVVGTGPASITVRVVGGAGRDRFVDQTHAAHSPFFYDGGGGSEFVAGPRTRIRRLTFDPPLSWGATAALTPDWGSAARPIPGVPFRGDLGFFPLAGIAIARYGFRKEPFLTQHQLKASYATAVSRFLLEYQLDWVMATDRARTSIDAYWSEVELIHYYGFGNDTDADRPRGFYDVRHDQASFSPSVTLTRGRLGMRLAAYVRRSVTDTSAVSLLAADRPYGFGTFAQAGGTLEFFADARNDAVAPTRGVRASAGLSYSPEVWSVDRGAFGAVDGTLAAYVSAFGDRQTLAARAGGRKIWGAFPIHDAAFLGGPETIRGFRTDRFAGDASLYGSLEIRSPIATFRFLFPNELGVVFFGDAGRVYVDGRSPGGWHTAAGGGLWIAPHARAHTFSVTAARPSTFSILLVCSALRTSCSRSVSEASSTRFRQTQFFS